MVIIFCYPFNFQKKTPPHINSNKAKNTSREIRGSEDVAKLIFIHLTKILIIKLPKNLREAPVVFEIILVNMEPEFQAVYFFTILFSLPTLKKAFN